MNTALWAEHCRRFFEFAQTKEVIKIEEPDIIIEPKRAFLNVEDIWEDIKSVIKSDKFYALSLVGPQGKGKTVLSSIFGTKAEQEGYNVVYGMPEDFIDDFDGWINAIKAKSEREGKTEKHCFILDDLSYYFESRSKRVQSNVKNVIARIRHAFEETINGKIMAKPIFVVYISHRLHAVPPMLRNSGSWIFSSMQAADREDMIKLIARRKAMQDRLDQIYTFISKVSVEGPKNGHFSYKVGNTEKTFKWGNEDDPGDGRLMVSYHAGELKIFQSQIIDNMVDLEATRIIPVKPEPINEEEQAMIDGENEDEPITKHIIPAEGQIITAKIQTKKEKI